MCGTWAPGHCGLATRWVGPGSQSGLGGAALLLAGGNFLACAASGVPTEKLMAKVGGGRKGIPLGSKCLCPEYGRTCSSNSPCPLSHPRM